MNAELEMENCLDHPFVRSRAWVMGPDPAKTAVESSAQMG